ncbi:hypothetical protein TNCV_2822921 [Trichonephila clavipes]|nr:hypothetical protein TNCV_2822921 [Trichonephila clavipes]
MTWFPSVAFLSHLAQHYSKQRRRWVRIIGSACNGCRYTRCPSARRLAMVRKDTRAHSEGAACVWTVANEASRYTRGCRMM